MHTTITIRKDWIAHKDKVVKTQFISTTNVRHYAAYTSRFMPSRVKDAEITLLLWPSNVCSHSSVIALQIRTVLSELAVTTFVPSGLKAAEFTYELWPSKVSSHSPVTALQIRAVLSSLPVTTFVPSGLKAAENTTSQWPSNVCSHSP
eukprot:SAG31_NODE_7347_length_1712_cov_8.465592_1_plen_147_part_10